MEELRPELLRGLSLELLWLLLGLELGLMLTSRGEGLKPFSTDWTLLNHVVEGSGNGQVVDFIAKALALVGSVSLLRFMTGQEDAFTVELPIFLGISVIVTVIVILIVKVGRLSSFRRNRGSDNS
ncbi:hypothetical protein [Brevundimonas kwangchunensis]|uniref:hypothetical protein n=1 Tax=Brevundimonas kwangchunensis TaxID=322163 RepID=UPI0031DEF45C